MNVLPTFIEGLYMLEPRVFEDERGYFFESYSERTMAEHGLVYNWVQDNEAKSSYGVVRGLHYQVGKTAQAKLVRVTVGQVLDVVLDIRPESKTYGKHFSIILSATNKTQLLVPRGMAHGYAVLSETALFQYKCDNFYSREDEGGVLLSDAELNIDWMIPEADRIISDKDKAQPIFNKHKVYH